METNNFKIMINKMTKLFLKISPFLLVFLLMIGFAHQAQAISVSIGDPKEVYDLWNNIRNQATTEYNLLQQEIKAGTATSDARYNTIIALIHQLDSLSAKFDELTKLQDKNILTVTYPNGGETFECGKNYTITWRTKIAQNEMGIEEITNPTFGIYLSAIDEFGGSYIYKNIVNNLTNKDNKYNWSVPCDIRAGSYKIRIVGNPESKITSFEDSSDALFKITSNVPDATIDSVSIDKSNIISGETINMSWSGSNVKEYRLYFGTEFGTGVTMDGKSVAAQSISMGLQTSASFNYINVSDSPKKVFVMVEAYGSHEGRDSSKQVEITVSPSN